MDKHFANTIIGLVNGLECNVMRETFLNLQNDKDATNDQLVQDATKWNSYLDSYCKIYKDMNKHIVVH